MAIAFANLGASAAPDFASATDASSYASASWTPPTSGLILLSVMSVRVAPAAAVPAVSGNGLTWVEIATITADAAWRLTLFGANASGSSTGATTISYGANTQLRCVASFSHATGVDLSGGVGAAFVQSVANTFLASSAPTLTLAAAGHSDNRPYSAWSHGNVASLHPVTPRTNWTEFDDIGIEEGGVVETQRRADAFETTASASTVAANNWWALAVEIKAEQAAAAAGTWAYVPVAS